MQAHHLAYQQLERLFGADNVREEIRSPQSFMGNEPEQPCYVVTIPPPELSHYNSTAYDFQKKGMRLERFLEGILEILPGTLETTTVDAIGQHTQGQAIPPIRLIFAASELEEPENVDRLKAISQGTIHNVLEYPNLDKLHEQHCSILRNVTYGIRWQLVSDAEGEYYQSTRRPKKPDYLQISLLGRLGLNENELIPSADGYARISFEAMAKGKTTDLMESIVPRPICELVATRNMSRKSM